MEKREKILLKTCTVYVLWYSFKHIYRKGVYDILF